MQADRSWSRIVFVGISLIFLSQQAVTQDTQNPAFTNGEEFESPVEENKRAWKQFQGSWGKRDSNDDLNEVKRAWKQFQGSWGKRPDSADWANSDSSNEMEKRGWSSLHGTWGKREEVNPAILRVIARSLLASSDLSPEPFSYDSRPFKRSWAKFAGTWGKRPHATRSMSPRSTNWSSLRGSWGKRDNWAHLRGAWGKRDDEE